MSAFRASVAASGIVAGPAPSLPLACTRPKLGTPAPPRVGRQVVARSGAASAATSNQSSDDNHDTAGHNGVALPSAATFAGSTVHRNPARSTPALAAASPSPQGGGGGARTNVVLADTPSATGDAAGAGTGVSSEQYFKDIMSLSVEVDLSEDEAEDFDETASAGRAATKRRKTKEKEKEKTKPVLTPEQAVYDKHSWMVVMVPEQPVAGEDFTIYFNSNASDSLRAPQRVQLQYAFNNWELKPEDGTPDRVDMQPTGITHEFGADFWSCTIQIPKNSYELNFVLSDGAWRFENNGGQDFKYPVQGGITLDEWIDQAGERAAKAAADMAAAEAARLAAAEAQRQENLLKEEKASGQRGAEALRVSYEQLRAGGGPNWNVLGDPKAPLWKTVPAEARAGSKVQLLYNRTNGPFGTIPIPDHEVLRLRYGYNNWTGPRVVEMKRYKPPRSAVLAVPGAVPVSAQRKAEQEGEWWVAELDIPFEAAVVNFVINYYEHYDNNDLKDYKLTVALPPKYTMDTWVEALSQRFFELQHAARLEAEAVAKRKHEARQAEKKKAQDLVKAVERRKVRHVLYTEPEVVTAGKEVTVYYNPRDTNLNGRQRIWLQGGWNRWTHRRKFGPLEMKPPALGEENFKATVKVPTDAFKMDFVFSDSETGEGAFDNRGGFDYHLPVEGSPVREPSLYVVHVAVEMAPIAKVGGLGDVVTALGRAVQDCGHQVEVILPKFQFFNDSPILQGQLYYETEYDWGGTHIYVTTAIVEGLRCWFIEPKNGFFDTGSVYGRYDDEVRFDFFCKAALEFLLRSGRQPDILHCHDWSTAYVCKSYWDDYNPYGLWKPKTVFTIHNLNYGKKKLSEAAYYCQKFTTVSPTYAFETGGNPVIASQTHKFMGIRNGIDPELWDPENNQWLPTPYSAANVVEGKAAARKRLREQLGMTGWGDKFIVGVVSRLTPQKGVHLIKHAAYRTVERGGQFVLLGSAPDPKVQAEFNALAGQLNGDVARFCFKYDEPLSHLIYAACDMIVVPSMFEPCGLTQMIAMRYGTVPIVRHTGGLKDTVFDVDFDKARAAWDVYGSSDWQRDGLDATNGFAFEGTDPGALDYAMNRAIDAWYNNKAWFQELQKRVMLQDWSWNRPALDYVELYHAAKRT